jgi:hypothetical protein
MAAGSRQSCRRFLTIYKLNYGKIVKRSKSELDCGERGGVVFFQCADVDRASLRAWDSMLSRDKRVELLWT